MCAQAKAQAVKDDLMNRLNNAIKQRDAAREEALVAAEKLVKLQEEIDSGALVPAGSAAAASAGAGPAASLTPPITPTYANAPATPMEQIHEVGGTGMLERARKYMGVPMSPTAPGGARYTGAEANGFSQLGSRIPSGLAATAALRRYPPAGSPLENGLVRFP
jgi:hypothetical protein